MESRELFEAWIKLQPINFSLAKFCDDSGDYSDSSVRKMWASWQASRGDLAAKVNF